MRAGDMHRRRVTIEADLPLGRVFRLFAALLLMLMAVIASAGLAAQPAGGEAEQFAGKTRLGLQSELPIHITLRRHAGAVTGTIAIPETSFELLDMTGTDPLVGTFRGVAGSGPVTISVKGDALTGAFNLGGQAGTITAHRVDEGAAAFFRSPEQRLDLTTEQWIQDLNQLVRIFEEKHPAPFHRSLRPALEHEVGELRKAIPKLSGMEVALQFHRLGAMIGDGHTKVDLPPHQSLGIELFWFNDGIRIVGVAAGQERMLGTKLLAIDGVPVSALAERARRYIPAGETEEYVRANVPAWLSAPDLLRAIGLSAGPSFDFRIATRAHGGETIKVFPRTNSGTWAILGGGVPLWQRCRPNAFCKSTLTNGSVYVNWRSYDGLRDATNFLRSLDARHPRKLIIDLRDNEGGDFNAGRRFIKEIAARPWLNQRGRLYVLIGRQTFSAAMTNAVDFQQMTHAVLLGEPAGAAPNNWQEVRSFYLANSGLRVNVSTQYYEFKPGHAKLSPNLSVPPEPADWGAPIDRAVRRAIEAGESR